MSVFFPLSGLSGGFFGIPGIIASVIGITTLAVTMYAASISSNKENSNKDISKESPLTKVVRGWVYKYYFFITDMFGMVDSWLNESPKRKVLDFGKLLLNLVFGPIFYLDREFKRDPVDAIIKLVMLIAGIVLIVVGVAGTPVTAGASNVLDIAGATLVASSIALFLKESYEYANAKTEGELVNLARDDEEEAVLIPLGAYGGWEASETAGLFSRMARNVKDIPVKWATDPFEMAETKGYDIASKYWLPGDHDFVGYDAYIEAGIEDMRAFKIGNVYKAGFFQDDDGKWYLGIYSNVGGNRMTVVGKPGILWVQRFWPWDMEGLKNYMSMIPASYSIFKLTGWYMTQVNSFIGATFNETKKTTNKAF